MRYEGGRYMDMCESHAGRRVANICRMGVDDMGRKISYFGGNVKGVMSDTYSIYREGVGSVTVPSARMLAR